MKTNNKKNPPGFIPTKKCCHAPTPGLIMHDISSPWSGVVGQLLAASRCAQGLVVSDKKHQAVMKDQRENAERKHRENTHKKHTENTNKKHRQKAQRENTDTKRRQKTQTENTDRNTDWEQTENTQTENTEWKTHKENRKKTQTENTDRKHREKRQTKHTNRKPKHTERKHRQKFYTLLQISRQYYSIPQSTTCYAPYHTMPQSTPRPSPEPSPGAPASRLTLYPPGDNHLQKIVIGNKMPGAIHSHAHKPRNDSKAPNDSTRHSFARSMHQILREVSSGKIQMCVSLQRRAIQNVNMYVSLQRRAQNCMKQPHRVASHPRHRKIIVLPQFRTRSDERVAPSSSDICISPHFWASDDQFLRWALPRRRERLRFTTVLSIRRVQSDERLAPLF